MKSELVFHHISLLRQSSSFIKLRSEAWAVRPIQSLNKVAYEFSCRDVHSSTLDHWFHSDQKVKKKLGLGVTHSANYCVPATQTKKYPIQGEITWNHDVRIAVYCERIYVETKQFPNLQSIWTVSILTIILSHMPRCLNTMAQKFLREWLSSRYWKIELI